MAKGGAGPAGAAAEIAMGFGMAQNMMAQGAFNMNPGAGAAASAAAPTAAPSVDILTPAQVAQTLGVTEADVLASIEGGQIKAKKIGTQFRITKAALDEFLAQ